MIDRWLVDTGPIVAILSRRDPDHKACFDLVRNRKGSVLTCWPVLTEVAWLLMYLAEREGIETVFTLDRRDFSVYRLRNGKAVRMMPDV